MKAILIDDERQSLNALRAKLELVVEDIEVIAMFQNPNGRLLKHYVLKFKEHPLSTTAE